MSTCIAQRITAMNASASSPQLDIREAEICAFQDEAVFVSARHRVCPALGATSVRVVFVKVSVARTRLVIENRVRSGVLSHMISIPPNTNSVHKPSTCVISTNTRELRKAQSVLSSLQLEKNAVS